jgi:hypothetical protein
MSKKPAHRAGFSIFAARQFMPNARSDRPGKYQYKSMA